MFKNCLQWRQRVSNHESLQVSVQAVLLVVVYNIKLRAGEVCFTLFDLGGEVHLPATFINNTQKEIELNVYMTCIQPNAITVSLYPINK